MAKKAASFLGANTPKGFVSLFDELYNPYDKARAYIIKGGPGTGKSTFMKKIADKAEKSGFFTERVYCSSDPSSLDAVIVPQMNFSICDGTSPHVVEPRFPGVAENILNLGEFWDAEKLRKNGDEIRGLFFENSLYHRKSGKYLAAAGHIDSLNRKLVMSYIRTEKTDSYSSRFIYRELPVRRGEGRGEKSRRFMSAITPRGNIFLGDAVQSLCPRVIGIDDSEGVVSSLITGRVGEGAVKNGYKAIYCCCPMNPSESEHLLVPEKGIAIVRLHRASCELPCVRMIHTGRFMKDGFRENRTVIKFNNKLKDELIRESVNCLKQAKATHDKLERIYIDAMDFERLNEYCQSFIDKLFT